MFGTGTQKIGKNSHQSLLILSNFAWFLKITYCLAIHVAEIQLERLNAY